MVICDLLAFSTLPGLISCPNVPSLQLGPDFSSLFLFQSNYKNDKKTPGFIVLSFHQCFNYSIQGGRGDYRFWPSTFLGGFWRPTRIPSSYFRGIFSLLYFNQTYCFLLGSKTLLLCFVYYASESNLFKINILKAIVFLFIYFFFLRSDKFGKINLG